MAKKKPVKKSLKKLELELKVLALIDQNLFGKQIASRLNYSQARITQVSKELVRKKLITEISKYPKLFKLTDNGISYSANKGQISNQSVKFDKNVKQEKSIKPDWIIEQRIHKLRYELPLFTRPIYLNSIGRYKQFVTRNNLLIKKVNMNNWDKYNIYFPYQQFNGLVCVEVCTNNIVFDFKRDDLDSIVSDDQGFRNFFAERERDVLQCAIFLNNKNFKIDIRNPKRISQSFAIQSDGSNKTIGTLGQYAGMIIKNGNETFEIDHSPPNVEGEEETDNFDKAKSMYDIPQNIEDMDDKMKNLDDKINALDNKLSTIEKALVSMVNQNQQMLAKQDQLVNQQTRIADQFEKFFKLQNPQNIQEDKQIDDQKNHEDYFS